MKFKRFLSICLVFVLILPFLPISTNAAGSIQYHFDNSTGVLSIYGSGAMMDYGDRIDYIPWRKYASAINKIVISPGITHIGDYAFYDIPYATSVSIPESVTSIGEGAFLYCSSLKNVSLPTGLKKLGDGAFAQTAITSITIPKGITELKPMVFYCCYELKSVTIKGPIKYFGYASFMGCESLKTVTVEKPESCTDIGEDAFSLCISLTSIPQLDALQTIYSSAFMSCKSLKKVTIPASVTYIGNYAFRECDSLQYIIFKGNAPYFEGSRAFLLTDTTAYYPAGNKTWTDDIMQDYGGDITWVPSVKLKINQQPADAYAAKGKTAKVTVKASGDGLKYQWYIKNPGASKFTKSSTTSSTYSVKMSASNNGRQVYCKITDIHGKSVQTDTVTLRIGNPAKITTQPKNATAPKGSKAKVTVKATGDGLKYTWYIKNPGASKFTKSSVTASSYSVKMSASNNGRQVYCKVTDKYGNSVKSDTVTLYMGNPVKITTQPKNATAPNGTKTKVTVKATGDGLKYQWYIKNPGASKFSKSSATSSTYSAKMSASNSGRQVYCKITDKYGNSVKTDTVTLYMGNPATITVQPTSTAAEKGQTVKVTVKATGDGLKYQWYIKNPGASKFSKSSVTSSTYSVEMSVSNDGRQVYCVITDKYGNSVKTNTATLSIK